MSAAEQLAYLQNAINAERGVRAPDYVMNGLDGAPIKRTLSRVANDNNKKMSFGAYNRAHIMAHSALHGGEALPHLMTGLTPQAVHIDAALTNMAVMFRNRPYIADAVLPVVMVPRKSDKYFVFNTDTMFTLASVNIAGNRGMPGEVQYGLASPGNYSVSDYGLMDFVSADEIANADSPLEPQATSVEITTNFLLLAREYRVAQNLVFNTSSYGSNHSALTGAAMWDQFATSDPINDIETAIEACLVRPTHLVLGVQVWLKLRMHPKLLQYVLARATTAAGPTPLRPTPQMVAEAFGLEGVFIGMAKYNSAAEGLTDVYSYLWGKSAALIRIEPTPNRRRTDSFGYTFRYAGDAGELRAAGLSPGATGGWEVRQIADLKPGVRGGVWNKITHSDTELSIAGGSAGYLYTTVVS